MRAVIAAATLLTAACAYQPYADPAYAPPVAVAGAHYSDDVTTCREQWQAAEATRAGTGPAITAILLGQLAATVAAGGATDSKAAIRDCLRAKGYTVDGV